MKLVLTMAESMATADLGLLGAADSATLPAQRTGAAFLGELR
jgi:hypothetical protein